MSEGLTFSELAKQERERDPSLDKRAALSRAMVMLSKALEAVASDPSLSEEDAINRVRAEMDEASENLFAGEVQEVGRWTWLHDMDEPFGGFASGEFMLRSDGRAFRRSGGSVYSAGETSWHFGPWQVEDGWDGGTDPQLCEAWLKKRGYEISPPSPCPADRTSFPDGAS